MFIILKGSTVQHHAYSHVTKQQYTPKLYNKHIHMYLLYACNYVHNYWDNHNNYTAYLWAIIWNKRHIITLIFIHSLFHWKQISLIIFVAVPNMKYISIEFPGKVMQLLYHKDHKYMYHFIDDVLTE